jgi:hypothetical protein
MSASMGAISRIGRKELIGLSKTKLVHEGFSVPEWNTGTPTHQDLPAVKTGLELRGGSVRFGFSHNHRFTAHV